MKKTLNALLVEDTPHDAELIQSSLERGGFKVFSRRVWDATTMAAALADGTWDVIVSDYRLRSFSGRAALEIYRREKLDIPFICVSEKIGAEEAAGMIRSGAQDFVAKKHLERLALVVGMELFRTKQRREQGQVSHVERLNALLPICAGCKKIRDDKGEWHQLEKYFHDHSEVEFSHSLCPECSKQAHLELNAM